MPENLIIIGYSGHAYVAIDIAQLQGYNIIGYIENEEKSSNPYNIDYLGNEDVIQNILNTNKSKLFIGIGSNKIREVIYKKLNAEFEFAVLKHKNSIQSVHSSINAGALMGAGSVVNSLASIGICSIINTGAIIEHECVVDDFVHIGPGAVLAGNVKIGKRSFIGANSVVKQGIVIGEDTIIGAGSVILHDVPSGATVVGNPGKIIIH